MAKLIPFNKAVQKKMGVVITKNGPMIDKSRLTDNKKYVKPEKPEVKQLNKEIKEQKKQPVRITLAQKQRNEAIGIY